MVRVCPCPSIGREQMPREVYGDWPICGHSDLSGKPMKRRRKVTARQLQEVTDGMDDCTIEDDDD